MGQRQGEGQRGVGVAGLSSSGVGWQEAGEREEPTYSAVRRAGVCAFLVAVVVPVAVVVAVLLLL